jgi:hypothetical protein
LNKGNDLGVGLGLHASVVKYIAPRCKAHDVQHDATRAVRDSEGVHVHDFTQGGVGACVGYGSWQAPVFEVVVAALLVVVVVFALYLLLFLL